MKSTVKKNNKTGSPAGKPLFEPIENIIRDVRRGRMVIVVDDKSRENEGDLIIAAEKTTDRAINFMARFGRGLICVAMTSEQLARLKIARPRAQNAQDTFKTAFMDSVDARSGITTGISAHDRARTIKVLTSDKSQSADLASPGHVFPLEARESGVLRRAGHTEAAVDLAQLAGLKPAGVICEIMRDDGRMARLPDLRRFAARHHLKITSVSDLIAFRRRQEKLVEQVRSVSFPTEYGIFTLKLYRARPDNEHHIALVMGEPEKDKAALVRVHSECLTGDVFGSQRCDCGSQLHASMKMIADKKSGVVLYMRQEGRGIGFEKKPHAYELQDNGLDTVDANLKLGFAADLRDYGIGAQILADLGIKKIRLITNNPRKVIGLEGYGMEIVERIAIISPVTRYNRRYLQTKKNRMGHLL